MRRNAYLSIARMLVAVLHLLALGFAEERLLALHLFGVQSASARFRHCLKTLQVNRYIIVKTGISMGKTLPFHHSCSK